MSAYSPDSAREEFIARVFNRLQEFRDIEPGEVIAYLEGLHIRACSGRDLTQYQRGELMALHGLVGVDLFPQAFQAIEDRRTGKAPS